MDTENNESTTETPPPATNNDDRNMAMLCHLLNIIGFIGPLIIWLIKKNESPLVEREGKEALNWGITVAIAWVALIILTAITFGLAGLLVPVLILLNLVFAIIGAMKTNSTGSYRYPFALRLLK